MRKRAITRSCSGSRPSWLGLVNSRLRSDDLDEILTEACQLIGDALGTDLAKVMQLQEDGETLLVRAGVGWKAGVVGKVTVQITDDTSEGTCPEDRRADDLPRYQDGDAGSNIRRS